MGVTCVSACFMHRKLENKIEKVKCLHTKIINSVSYILHQQGKNCTDFGYGRMAKAPNGAVSELLTDVVELLRVTTSAGWCRCRFLVPHCLDMTAPSRQIAASTGGPGGLGHTSLGLFSVIRQLIATGAGAALTEERAPTSAKWIFQKINK